jgi:hypothetical protein
MDLSFDITYQYIARLRYHEDSLGIVLKGHLLIEYVLDVMIEKGLREPKPILSDHRSFPFAVKARLLYETGHLSKPIFRNIARITRIRNELAHTLSLNPDKLDFKFDTDYGESPGEVEVKKQVRRANNPVKNYLWLLCFGTLSQVQRAYYQRFSSWPLFDRPLEM